MTSQGLCSYKIRSCKKNVYIILKHYKNELNYLFWETWKLMFLFKETIKLERNLIYKYICNIVSQVFSRVGNNFSYCFNLKMPFLLFCFFKTFDYYCYYGMGFLVILYRRLFFSPNCFIIVHIGYFSGFKTKTKN